MDFQPPDRSGKMAPTKECMYNCAPRWNNARISSAPMEQHMFMFEYVFIFPKQRLRFRVLYMSSKAQVSALPAAESVGQDGPDEIMHVYV